MTITPPPINADTLDGKHASDFASSVHNHGLAKVVTVALSGGQFTDPIEALNSIIDASSSNPYLIRIAPGIYDLGGRTLAMKSYVDIEGSGENMTILKGTPPAGGALIVGADSTELRLLTVEHQNWTGILNDNTSPSIRHVKVVTHGDTGGNGASNISISNRYSQAVIRESQIVSSGYDGFGTYENIGIYNLYSSPLIEDTRITSSEASTGLVIQNENSGTVIFDRVTVNTLCNMITMQTYQSKVILKNSRITSENNVPALFQAYDSDVRVMDSTVSAVGCIFNNGMIHVDNSELVNPPGTPGYIISNNDMNANATAYINNTKLDGVLLGSYNGQIKCLNTYNEAYDAVICP